MNRSGQPSEPRSRFRERSVSRGAKCSHRSVGVNLGPSTLADSSAMTTAPPRIEKSFVRSVRACLKKNVRTKFRGGGGVIWEYINPIIFAFSVIGSRALLTDIDSPDTTVFPLVESPPPARIAACRAGRSGPALLFAPNTADANRAIDGVANVLNMSKSVCTRGYDTEAELRQAYLDSVALQATVGASVVLDFPASSDAWSYTLAVRDPPVDNYG